MSAAALEFALPPAEAARLPGALAPATPQRPTGPVPVRTVWHDTAGAALAASGLVLAEQDGMWRLERMWPDGAGALAPGLPALSVAEAPDAAAAAAGTALDGEVLPLARFEGRCRRMRLQEGGDEVEAELLEGVLHGVTAEIPCCRLRLAGAAAPLLALTARIADGMALSAPRGPLAAEALVLARGAAALPPPEPVPLIVPGESVSATLARLVGHLALVILRWGESAADGGSAEPVHQMRVATRRLRSALALFRRAASGPALAAADDGLRSLAARLGAARDWDVFLEETAAPVLAAFPGDRRLARLEAAARRRRATRYAELAAWLGGQEFRLLGVALATLAALRPWEQEAEAEADRADMLARDIADAAPLLLSRRLARLRAHGDGIGALPEEALHALRRQGKRLRYACEFCAPLGHPRARRRFLRRLARLQDRLGRLNDGATAAGLLAQLGGGHGFAAGAVLGFLAARNEGMRGAIDRAWDRLLQADPFWT